MKIKFRWIFLGWAVLAASSYGLSTIWHPSLDDKLLLLFFVAMFAIGGLAHKLDRIESKLDAALKPDTDWDVAQLNRIENKLDTLAE